MWGGSRLPFSVVWDSKTFNIHYLQLTTPMLSLHLMTENKTHNSYRTRMFPLRVFQLLPQANFGNWEIKNKRWTDWRSTPSLSWDKKVPQEDLWGTLVCQWFELSHLLLQKALVSSSSACQRTELRVLQCHRPGLCLKLALLLEHKGRGQ